MKKLISFALSCAMILSLAACGKGETQSGGSQGGGAQASSGSGSQTVTVESPAENFKPEDYLSGNYVTLPADGPTVSLTIGHAMQETTDSHKMMLALKSALEQYSGGKISVTIYPNSQIGSDAEMIASCVAGDVDIVYQSGSTHNTFVPATNLFDVPFLLSGYEKDKIYDIMTDSEFRELYNQANEEAGFVLLMLRAGDSGMNFTANRAASSVADLKGLKIRTAQVENRMALWSALDANPTPMAFSELYMALQNGTVDGQENNLSNTLNSAVYDVNKYLFLTDHSSPSMEMTMNRDKFYAMPQEYQELLTQICKELSRYDWDLSVAMADYYLDCLTKEHGMTACEISDEFRAELKEKAAPVIDKVKATVGNDALYETLIAELNS